MLLGQEDVSLERSLEGTGFAVNVILAEQGVEQAAQVSVLSQEDSSDVVISDTLDDAGQELSFGVVEEVGGGATGAGHPPWAGRHCRWSFCVERLML